MAVTNLTNTKWLINSITCTAGYGQFHIEGTIDDPVTDNPQIDAFYVGYRMRNFELSSVANYIFLNSLPTHLSVGDTITITSGTDVTNASLISWLEANATQVVETSGKMYLGTSSISKMYFGQQEVSKVYFGQDLVYENKAPISMPSKGDIINIDITGGGTTSQFRVLEVNGTQAKLLAMTSTGTSVFNTSSTTTTFDNGLGGMKYQDSALDNAMTAYYNAMSANVKNAIVAQNRIQMMYDTSESSSFTYSYQYEWDDNYYYYANIQDHVTIGSRYCFALDLKDIFDYFGKNTITSNELNTMFFNQASSYSESVWLCSARANYANAWYMNGSLGCLFNNSRSYTFAVRPAFVIDLSNIEWTTN